MKPVTLDGGAVLLSQGIVRRAALRAAALLAAVGELRAVIGQHDAQLVGQGGGRIAQELGGGSPLAAQGDWAKADLEVLSMAANR